MPRATAGEPACANATARFSSTTGDLELARVSGQVQAWVCDRKEEASAQVETGVSGGVA
jgi:hypothetical protein